MLMKDQWLVQNKKHQLVELKKTVDEFGLGLLTAATVGIGIHAIASAVAGKKNQTREKINNGKKHLVIDPITRIEGHLRIEAIIDENNVVVDAFSSSTMFRGIEEIFKRKRS